MSELSLNEVYKATHVLKSIIKPTALIKAPSVNPSADIYIKPENLQITGSFKVRGASYKISQLSDEEKAHGVIACSAGNHAQGVAFSSTASGIKSIICLPIEGKKTVCVVSGGNVDVTFLNRIINRGLQRGGRQCTICVELMDSPGQLVFVSQLIANEGANVTSVMHERTNTEISVNACTLRITMETRNADHIKIILDKLKDNGIRILSIPFQLC